MSRSTFTVLKLAVIVSLGGFLFGFDASVISGVVSFVVPEFGLTDWQLGFVVSAPTLAAIFAGLGVGPLSDSIGRKKVLLIVAFLYALAAVVSAMAPNFIALVLARAIGGAAFGSLVLAPMYIAEVSPPKLRGIMVSVNQLNIVVGFSVAYFANLFFLRASSLPAPWVHTLGIDAHPWRWMLGVQVVPALIYFTGLFLVPESPRWLVVKGRVQQAREILGRTMPPAEVELAMAEIQGTATESGPKTNSRIRELFRPELRFALLIGFIVGVAQQITGVNAVYFYAPSIFEQSGVGTDAAFAQAIWVGIINVIFTIIAMAMIDRVGRKPLLILGLTGVLVSMSLAAYGFNQATYELTPAAVAELPAVVSREKLQPLVGVTYPGDLEYKNALDAALGHTAMKANEGALIKAAIRANPILILVGILGFVASFAISLGPVMWVLLSEIYPSRIRGLAISVVTFANSGVSFGVQMLFPWELSHLGNAWTFLIYGLFAGASLIFVAWLLPETKGRTLEQLEQQFAAGRKKAARPVPLSPQLEARP